MNRSLLMKFLDRSTAKEFIWGENDCSLDLADWLGMNGFDVAKDWRGTYSSELECQALLDARGGLLSVITAEASRLGLQATARPQQGDIAVITINGRSMCAIMMPSGRWRMRTLDGFVVSKAGEVIAAWSVPCRR